MARTLLVAAALLVGARPAWGQTGPRTLTLQQALEELDARSLTVAQARARADEARAIVRQANAALVPSLVAGGSYYRNSAEAKIALGQLFALLHLPESGIPAETIIQPIQALTATGSLRVPLFAGNAYSDIAAARKAAGAAEISVDSARLQVRAALQNAGWSSQAAEEVVKASERAVKNARDLAESAARALEAGTGAPLAKQQSETELVRREADLVRAKAELDRSRLILGVLLGRAELVRVQMPELSAPESVSAEDLVQEGLSRRPEIKAQQLASEAADRRVDSAFWKVAPTLSAGLSAFASSVPFPTGDNLGWQASVNLSWALYDGGFRYGQQRQAEAQVAANRAALDAQRVDVEQQARDAARDLEVAKERLRLVVRQQQLASEAAATARRSYEAGLASYLEVVDANDQIYLSDIALADARARLGAALVAVEKASAKGL